MQEIKIFKPEDDIVLRSNEQVFLYDPLQIDEKDYDELRKLHFEDNGNRKKPLADDSKFA